MTQSQAPKRPPRKISTETLGIMDRMRRAAIGELAPYQQLLDLTGFPDIDSMRPYIATAKRRLWRKEHIYICVERGKGLVRTDGSGAVDYTLRGEEKLARGRKRLRRQWENIIDAEGEKLAIRTKQLYKHAMTATLERLFQSPALPPLRELLSRPKLDPAKVLQLFERKQKIA